MKRLIADRAGYFTCDVEVNGTVLVHAIEHDRAEEVLESAMAAALSVLAEDEPYLEQYLDHLAAFMVTMRRQVLNEDRH
jgi:hypothetical protein